MTVIISTDAMKQYMWNGVNGFRLRLIPFYVDFKKLAILSLVFLCCYFIIGDVYLYMDIQANNGHLPIFPGPNETYPCYSSPICSYSVKTLFLDFPSFYIFLPLSALIHDWLPFTTTLSFITPSMISFTHVLIAGFSIKCVAHDSISVRRFGVFIYQIRNFLDGLDGTMARSRFHRGLTNENDRFIGHYIDGFCDALGCIAIVAGCYMYLHRHPMVRPAGPYAYSILPLFVTSRFNDRGESEPENDLPTKTYKKGKNGCETISGRIAVYFLIQSTLCSLIWNGYIDKFTQFLETPNTSHAHQMLQGAAARSTTFWIMCQLWRLVNPHSMYEFLCLAIVVDKMGEFFSKIQYLGYVAILGAAVYSQLYYMHLQLYDEES